VKKAYYTNQQLTSRNYFLPNAFCRWFRKQRNSSNTTFYKIRCKEIL